jgi:hypothetical protein
MGTGTQDKISGCGLFCYNLPFETASDGLDAVLLSFLVFDAPFTLQVREMKFCVVKDHGHTYKFYLNHYFL